MGYQLPIVTYDSAIATCIATDVTSASPSANCHKII